ncbi:PadR family transcriptional regulator [Agromyces subbeticus]|uniref:PadR family transcriptional regulator n=1 Tax=Agromyces subbeticus TaxID=293890 RepID=UPI0003B5B925|nr:helix-turn-helix transcriptional regulator [Agromyces subbeticus]
MAVRDGLLALLSAGPGYGFQLHGDLAVRTGGRRNVNVGQSYATLERLGKQGLIESAGATDDGLPLHRATAAGATATAAWLNGTDASGSDPWDETVDRVLLAASLPGVDAGVIITAERRRWNERLAAASARSLTGDGAAPSSSTEVDPPAELAALAAAADSARARAALEWLAEVGVAIEARDLAFAPRLDRPRRGRPSTRPMPPDGDDGQASASA